MMGKDEDACVLCSVSGKLGVLQLLVFKSVFHTPQCFSELSSQETGLAASDFYLSVLDVGTGDGVSGT